MPAEPPLEQAIAQLEGHRASLGDAAVDAAIAALRRHAPSPQAAATDATAGAAAGAGATTQRLRQVSVLFADVADSTAMLGRVGAEDAQDLLDRALQRFAEAVQHFDGQVLRFTGDGLKAAFGTRGLREDEAERAVRAGLRILQDAAHHAERVQRELGVAGFGVRVGIHTGPVLLGGGVEAERTAIGHAVHLAARMEQSAPVGALRVSDATWAQVRGLFRAQAQPPLMVKGHAEPLRTWLVLGPEEGPEPSVQRGVDGVATPMIGRDAELAALLALHARCVAERQAVVAQVVADAGVGKTRLRRELLHALGLAEGDAGLLQARAQPSTRLQPYGLLRQLVTRWLGIRDDDDAEAARERLWQGLSPWLGAAAGQAAPRIGQLIGLDFTGHPAVQALGAAGLRSAGFDALRAVLRARAAAAPLLVVLDDLHWADDDSLDFVQSLCEAFEGDDDAGPGMALPCMLLLLARPAWAERQAASARPVGARRLALTLAPLDAAQGHTLVDALLQPLADAPPTLRHLLAERGAGNPFYLEALVRMLVDDGVIDATVTPWRLNADRLAALRVPPTLLGVLQARLDALPEPERRALQQASIIGPVFWDAALDALATGAPAALPALARRTLVVARERSAFADTAEQAFAHALLHDATYATVLKEQRREGHARAARWLASRVTDRAADYLAITAEHYERAGDSANALEYWDQAHHAAFARFANAAGAHFAERALAQPALTDARWRFQLLANLYLMCERQSLVERVRQVAAELAAWAERCDDDAMRAQLHSVRMLTADQEGRPAEALALARQTLELSARAGDVASPAAALAHGELAWLALQRRDWATTAAEVAAGIERARVAGTVPRRHGGYGGYERQLRVISLEALVQQERYVEALTEVEQALAALAAIPSPVTMRDRFNLLLVQASVERQLGRPAAALGHSREALALADAAAMARLQRTALAMVARSFVQMADLERLRETLDAADAVDTAAAHDFDRLTLLESRAELARLGGDPDAARVLWQQALALCAAQDRAPEALEPRGRLARLDLERGDAARAREGVDAVLAGAGEAPARLDDLPVPALVDAHAVLAALDDPRAPMLLEHLQARLRAQLSSLPDDGARRELVQGVPHWREVHALTSGAHSTAAETATTSATPRPPT